MSEPDEVGGRDARPARSSGLTLVVLIGGAFLVAVLLGQLTAPNPPPGPPTAVATTSASDLPTTTEPDVPIGVESLKRCPVGLGGLDLAGDMRVPGSTYETWDCDVLTLGPWSLVIRATNGTFGSQSAIATFPYDGQGSGTPQNVPNGGRWDPGTQTLVWPLAGSHAQIVGDVGQSQLIDLAVRITVEGGKPHLAPLAGFGVAATVPFASPAIHEMRYETADLGLASTLGRGQVTTGVTTGASFEATTLSGRADFSRPAGFVRGKPAITSREPGAAWTLAWESAPGELTYIGYSGPVPTAESIETLRALADKGKVLTPAQWETRSRAQVGPQSDTPP